MGGLEFLHQAGEQAGTGLVVRARSGWTRLRQHRQSTSRTGVGGEVGESGLGVVSRRIANNSSGVRKTP